MPTDALGSRNKKIKIGWIIFGGATLLVGVLSVMTFILLNAYHAKDQAKIAFSISENHSDSYAEYAFDAGKDQDTGFTRRALQSLRKQERLLDEGSQALPEGVMKSLGYVAKDEIIERWSWGDDLYDLTYEPAAPGNLGGRYLVMKNWNLLFERDMAYGAEGPISDARIVDGKPAFTFLSECRPQLDRTTTCSHDAWYDGDFLSEKFGVEDPRYLFSYHGKLGFVASQEGQDKIFYDGKFITPGFDVIWTRNCCAAFELLPTTYENGTLLFYATRNDAHQNTKKYLVEVRLK